MSMPWYQKKWAIWLSYIIPFKITGVRSEIHPRVDLVLYLGKLMLNGQTVNYSGGGLYDLFQLFFQWIRRDIPLPILSPFHRFLWNHF